MILADSDETRRRAAREVARGGIVAFRTDTFYGLGVDPFNAEALRAVNRLKGSEREGKPLLVVISDLQLTARLVARETPLFRAVAARHWPGALTLVCSAHADVPEELTAGTGTIGVRLPADEEVRAFIRACGGALTATSANLAGRPPATNAREVAESFDEGLSIIVDGGQSQSESPSTVLDVTTDTARLIRTGVVTREELLETLGQIE